MSWGTLILILIENEIQSGLVSILTSPKCSNYVYYVTNVYCTQDLCRFAYRCKQCSQSWKVSLECLLYNLVVSSVLLTHEISFEVDMRHKQQCRSPKNYLSHENSANNTILMMSQCLKHCIAKLSFEWCFLDARIPDVSMNTWCVYEYLMCLWSVAISWYIAFPGPQFVC